MDYEMAYSLKRAGPQNFDKFIVKNYLHPKLGSFDYASYPIKDVYSLPIQEVTSIEVKSDTADSGTRSLK